MRYLVLLGGVLLLMSGCATNWCRNGATNSFDQDLFECQGMSRILVPGTYGNNHALQPSMGYSQSRINQCMVYRGWKMCEKTKFKKRKSDPSIPYYDAKDRDYNLADPDGTNNF